MSDQVRNQNVGFLMMRLNFVFTSEKKYTELSNILMPYKGQGAALGRPKGQGGFFIFKMRAGCSPL